MNAVKVSVGIPAYNEESNIATLLRTLLAQKQEGFEFANIWVVSDKSSDGTVEAARSVLDPRIHVSEGEARKGKVAICNELLAKNESDYLLQLDADIAIQDDMFIAKLVRTAMAESAEITCPVFAPLSPRTFAERIAYFGIVWWDEILKDKSISKKMLHQCIGRARLFSLRFTSTFRFPETIGSSEDVYAYFWAIQNGYKVACAEDAIAYYRLPTTARDYVSQMRRFLDTGISMEKMFGPELYGSENQVTMKLKFKYMLKLLATSNPLVSIAYIAFQFYAHATVRLYKQHHIWSTAASTKVLK